MNVTSGVVVFALGLASCGVPEGGVDRDLEELTDHLDAMARDVDAHASDVETTAAEGAGAMDASEVSHDADMGEHMAGMRHEIGDMDDCMDAEGRRPDTRAMGVHMDDMAGELEGHASAMPTMVDVQSALDEEHRHQVAMHVLIERTRAAVDGMRKDDGGMMADQECGADMHGR